ADDDLEETALTHGGKALDLDRDDFDMEGLEGSDDESDRGLKRRRSSAGSEEDDDDEAMSDDEGQDPDKPARKKSKAEVMKEVIAKSKKQKQQDRKGNNDSRVQRNAALQQIRDSFNPFEIKANNRPAKFQSFTAHPKKDAVLRPGVTKSMGEEARRATLLPEIQRRNKTGGIIDRRIGENDPTMTPEERALQRFAQEKMRKKGGASLFDLEADDDLEETALTHGGKALDLDRDDFDMEGLEGSDDESDRG
ncbi:Nop14-like protein, partial [Aureobasidium melanogenum]